MNELLDGLHKNADILTGGASFFGALMAGFYSFLTLRLLAETRAMRKVQTDPLISTALRQDEQYPNKIHLDVTNSGQGPAQHVRVEFSAGAEDPTTLAVLEQLRHLKGLEKGLLCLAPKQRFSTFLICLLDGDYFGVKIDFTVTYKDYTGRVHTESSSLEFCEFEGIVTPSKPALTTIAEELTSMREFFVRSHIQVDTHSPSDKIEKEKRFRQLQAAKSARRQLFPSQDSEVFCADI